MSWEEPVALLTPKNRHLPFEAEASEADILTWIEQTKRVAEIPNSLRLGMPVILAEVQAISVEQ